MVQYGRENPTKDATGVLKVKAFIVLEMAE